MMTEIGAARLAEAQATGALRLLLITLLVGIMSGRAGSCAFRFSFFFRSDGKKYSGKAKHDERKTFPAS
jgi:hypothetical protein